MTIRTISPCQLNITTTTEEVSSITNKEDCFSAVLTINTSYLPKSALVTRKKLKSEKKTVRFTIPKPVASTRPSVERKYKKLSLEYNDRCRFYNLFDQTPGIKPKYPYYAKKELIGYWTKLSEFTKTHTEFECPKRFEDSDFTKEEQCCIN